MDEEIAKVRRRERMREWNQKNKEKYRDARREACRKWREKHPEKYKKSYMDTNVKRREKNKAYHSIPINKERRRELQRARRAANPEQYKQTTLGSHLKKKYKITVEERDAMLAAQGGVCAGCGTNKPTGPGWCVDHCHELLEIRGILCFRCNTVLGYANDRAETLRALADYLGAFNDTHKL